MIKLPVITKLKTDFLQLEFRNYLRHLHLLNCLNRLVLECLVEMDGSSYLIEIYIEYVWMLVKHVHKKTINYLRRCIVWKRGSSESESRPNEV